MDSLFNSKPQLNSNGVNDNFAQKLNTPLMNGFNTVSYIKSTRLIKTHVQGISKPVSNMLDSHCLNVFVVFHLRQRFSQRIGYIIIRADLTNSDFTFGFPFPYHVKSPLHVFDLSGVLSAP